MTKKTTLSPQIFGLIKKTLTFTFTLFILLSSSNTSFSQVSYDFESLSGTDFTSSCRYTDANNTSEHYLENIILGCGEIVVTTPCAADFSFKTQLDPLGSNGSSGFSDGDAFGVATAASITSLLAAAPDAGQAFIMQDVDGEVDMEFSPVDLTGTTAPEVSVYYMLSSTGYESADYLYIHVEITGCGIDESVSLIDTRGSDIDDLMIEGAWTQLTADLTAYVGCTAQLIIEVSNNAGSEEVGIDLVNFTEGAVSSSATDNQVAISNTSPNIPINVFTVDAMGVETWVQPSIQAGEKYTQVGADGDQFAIRNELDGSLIMDYTVAGTCQILDVEIDACMGDNSDVDMDTYCDAAMSCTFLTGDIKGYGLSDGANSLEIGKTTMRGGPFDDQLFSDNAANMIGTSGNTVALLDPATNLISTYVMRNGLFVNAYTATTLSGGALDGMMWSAVASSIIGVHGLQAMILTPDGSIDNYNISSGALTVDRTQTAFFDGPLAGLDFTTATIVGAKTANIFTVLEADGTFVNYATVGRVIEDLTTTALTGGAYDGSTIAAEGSKIIGVVATNNVYFLEPCSVPPVPLFSTPNTNNNLTNQFDVKNQSLSLTAYPNPIGLDNMLNVDINTQSDASAILQLTDVSGKVWMTRKIQNIAYGIEDINMNEMPNGIYFLSVITDKDNSTIKVVKSN